MRYQAPKGTFDLFPPESKKWQWLEQIARETAELYGFQEIRTPIFESTEIFSRGIGEVTDIVEKEMYTFTDKGERSLTLRPEFTAPVVRAFVEHNLDKKGEAQKYYYLGPIFRYERPQAGRFRQAHQFGVEAFGLASPLLDAEVIAMAHDFYKKLGLTGLEVELNTIGCGNESCRPRYTSKLIEYLQSREESLCEDCRRRSSRNPLRALDCKNPHCREVVKAAPQIAAFLCPECQEHHRLVKEHLTNLEIPYRDNPQIVRGLDYYTRTVFEVISQDLGAQNTLCGGGRYDNLVETLGGRATPAVGFASGIERALLVREKQAGEIPLTPPLDVYILPLKGGENDGAVEKNCALWAGRLRKAGLKTHLELQKSLKAALKQAGESGAAFCLLIGENEIKEDRLTLKNLQLASQISIPGNRLAELSLNHTGKALVEKLKSLF